MISIINYGMGNIRSVQGALSYLNAKSQLVDQAEAVRSAEKIILPGVGNFKKAMTNLNELGLVAPLKEAVKRGTPLLGICLGMQLLAEKGEESGETEGLGWIPGKVERFRLQDPSLKIPHIGFSSTSPSGNTTLFRGMGELTDFYYVHSFHLACTNERDVAAWCDYGGKFTAAVQKDNVYGTQFHPEKSQGNGLRLLKNFLEV